jgi:hypothetical protein
MKKVRFVFLGGALFEFGKFFGAYYLLFIYIGASVFSLSGFLSFSLLGLFLILPAVYFFVFYDLNKYKIFIPIIILAKLFNLVPLFILINIQKYLLLQFWLPLMVISVFDLIFFIFLVSYSIADTEKAGKENIDHLPEFKETTIKGD